MGITIKDVAKNAEVSVSTVSRVLNGKDRVDPDTRKKVMEVIKSMNYVPNNLAVSMVKKKSNILGVVIPEIMNPFYAAVVKGAEEIAKKKGYVTLILITNDDAKEENNYYNTILTKYIDGIILIGSHVDKAFYQKIKKPTVLVDRYFEDTGKQGVVIDNFSGTYQLTNHLIENGHRDIAIINGLMDYNDGVDRFEGFLCAMKDNQIETKDSYIKMGNWFEEDGYSHTKELLKQEDPPTAIVACNNLICIGAIKAIREQGLEVGKDISLVGFDDHDLAAFNQPGITVVDRPTSVMGVRATEMLIEEIENGFVQTEQSRKVNLGVSLIYRGSVKKIN
ncbi:LacI family DNA-binding transcriptional regulator [Salipaludibacillus aurantiacus]|uniref:LacI family transcriptional regulator n=1 Tax=Salipaludibacillus aurantiacus TaxID=1601833 RepID=A0A1H9W2L6_9BACI|nr:LacI family DNA-binding transcriptional regulator [Salipaludibacillus aurantiacus]SES28001.1 LacI family transcriptional regulator [Salipaludibacillus aurantiacus]